MGYPQFLDGFRADGSPVWKSNLQSIDPFRTREYAAEAASKIKHHEWDKILECGTDKDGLTVIIK